MTHPKNAGRAFDPAHTQNKKSAFTLTATDQDGKVIDLSERSQWMNRDESILWPNRKKNALAPTQPDFKGIVRLSSGAYYRVGIWANQDRFSCWFTPFNPHWKTGFEPVTDLNTIKVQLAPCEKKRGLWIGETRSARVELWRATANSQDVYWLRLARKR